MSGTVYGNAFQARDIAGNININNYYGTPPSPPSQPPPVAPPMIPLAATPRPRRRWTGAVGKWCWEWLLSFAPIFFLSAVPGGIALGLAGDASVVARLACLVIGLVVVGVIGLAWWLVSRRRSQLSAHEFALVSLDRLAFKRLGAVGVPSLIGILVIGVGAVISSIVQQPQLNASGDVRHPAIATVFFVLVVLVAARRLARRD